MPDLNYEALDYVEKLLQEGKREQARQSLIGYVQQHPASERAWWLLSFAVNDPKQQVDCLNRVLRINPGFIPAIKRLEFIKASLATGSSPFAPAPAAPAPARKAASLDPAEIPAAQPALPARKAVSAQPARKQVPVKKTPKWVIPAAIVSAFLCLSLGIAGIFVLRGQFSAVIPSQPEPFTVTLPTQTLPPPKSLPATWTPTSTATPRPTSTMILVPTTEVAVLPKIEFNTRPQAGFYAPDFTLKNVNDGEQVSLSDYEGQPVILFFWTTWCPYCKSEMESFQTIYETYKDSGLVVLGIDVGESASQARTYRDKHGLTFPILNDSGSEVSRLYNVNAFPTHYFITTIGQISTARRGMMDFGSLKMLTSLMMGAVPTATP